MGVKLWNCATKGDKEVANILPSWRVIYETMTVQEKSHAKVKENTSCSPSTEDPGSLIQSEGDASPLVQPSNPPPVGKPKGGPLPSVRAFTAGYCPNDSKEEQEDPFDPGSIDPEREPDLYPPDPHDNWAHLKWEALKEGDLDIAEKIVASVLYQGKKTTEPTRGANVFFRN